MVTMMRRSPLQQPALQRRLPHGEGETGPEHLFQQGLQQGRLRAQPQRMNDHQVPRPLQVGLDRRHGRWRRVLFPVVAAAQNRKRQVGQTDQPDLVSTLPGSGRIGTGDRMTEAGHIRVGVTVDEGDAQGHGSLRGDQTGRNRLTA